MGERVTVDADALAAAGRASMMQAATVRSVQAESQRALSRAETGLFGSQSAAQVAALRRAVDDVLARLWSDLDELGRLLVAAAAGYEQAEQAATSAAGGTPAVASSGRRLL